MLCREEGKHIMSTAKTIITKPIPRRTVLGGMAASAFTLARPYVARAQQADINIGVLLPFTGSQGAYGPDMRKAAELTTKIVNDAGGILGGRKFRLFFEDDESSPTAGLAATKKLLEVNKCVAVIGIWGSPIAMAIKPVLVNANTCMMVSGAANAITDGDTKGLVWRFQAIQKLMGATDDTALYLFAGNTHDQICTLALAMEKAKSTDSLVYTKEIPTVDNPPGEEVDDILVALEKVRQGVKINFQGAGSICDFDARGDQLNRHFGHFRIEKGRQVLVQIIKGPTG
jgi:Periplasmic binding protein